jgi:hypothetical protein
MRWLILFLACQHLNSGTNLVSARIRASSCVSGLQSLGALHDLQYPTALCWSQVSSVQKVNQSHLSAKPSAGHSDRFGCLISFCLNFDRDTGCLIVGFPPTNFRATTHRELHYLDVTTSTWRGLSMQCSVGSCPAFALAPSKTTGILHDVLGRM